MRGGGVYGCDRNKHQGFGVSLFYGQRCSACEIAKATGRSAQFLARGLREGIFDFGFAVKSDSGNQYSYFCPDKLVWEKLGYFNPVPDKQDSKPDVQEEV